MFGLCLAQEYGHFYVAYTRENTTQSRCLTSSLQPLPPAPLPVPPSPSPSQDPATIRPADVLARALALVKQKWVCLCCLCQRLTLHLCASLSIPLHAFLCDPPPPPPSPLSLTLTQTHTHSLIGGEGRFPACHRAVDGYSAGLQIAGKTLARSDGMEGVVRCCRRWWYRRAMVIAMVCDACG